MNMQFSTILVATGIWMFLFRKLPSWSWFASLQSHFPKPLKNLWEGWVTCSYCGGFWIALALRATTELHTIRFSSETPMFISWPLDALATGVGILFIIRILDALKRVAYQGRDS